MRVDASKFNKKTWKHDSWENSNKGKCLNDQKRKSRFRADSSWERLKVARITQVTFLVNTLTIFFRPICSWNYFLLLEYSLDGWSHVLECFFEFQKLPKFGCHRLSSKQTNCKQRFSYLYQALIIGVVFYEATYFFTHWSQVLVLKN